MTQKPKIPDGETRTSRIVGSVAFDFPDAPALVDEKESDLLRIVSGVRCAMPFTVKVGKSSGLDEDAIREIVEAVFDLVQSTLSNWNPKSEINKVNALPAGKPFRMSDTLQRVVLASKEMVKHTNGAFDPSVAPILDHYELKAASESKSETSSEVAESSSNTDLETSRRQQVVLNIWKDLLSQGYSSDPKDSRISQKVRRLLQLSHWSAAFSVHKEIITKKHDDARIDLSGITKGFAVDEIARRLPSPCYVEWAGEVKVVGKHPNGRPWQIAVVRPPSLLQLKGKIASARKEGQFGPVYTLSEIDDDESREHPKYLAFLELNDGDAIATSGDCEKVVEKGGKLYCHIINPRLGRLLEINEFTLAQAVIVCKSCMFADALSTAAISMEDPSKARAMLEPFRTNFKEPISDFLLYARGGPRIIRLSVPGIEPKELRKKRLQLHKPAKVVVVGSGLAGMCAAIEAADARAKVIILEKEDSTGGNSAKATSGINGWGTFHQASKKIPDDERMFERDTHRSGKGGRTHPSLVRALSTQSAPVVDWLEKKFGIQLSVVSQLGGHSAPRTHRAPPGLDGKPVPIGYCIMEKMKLFIERHCSDSIEIRCGAKVTKFHYSVDADGVKTVTGVKFELDGLVQDEYADSIILATGGFGCCMGKTGLMARYRPDLLKCPTTNGPFARGEGVVLGEGVGAELIDMDKVQLHPTGFIDPKDPSNTTKILAPEALRGSGGILVNSAGERFVNELDLRSVVASAILNKCPKYKTKNEEYVGPPFSWCILSQESQALFGLSALEFYRDRLGLFEACDDVDQVAALIGCEKENLVSTLQAYANARASGSCPLTFKNLFPSSDLSPESKALVVARVTPSIHYTMGGISINAASEVQERLKGHFGHHRHVRGLYAAGEVTGGVHGGNRLAGNSLLECCVFGRIAGERAATVKQPNKLMFPQAQTNDRSVESEWVPVVLREVKNTDEKYGKSTMEVRFNLYGALQHSGLDVGQFIGLRGEFDGETLMGYFSPITRPNDEGVIGILCRIDEKGGPITKLLRNIRPGSVLHMSPMGGLRLKFQNESVIFRGKQVKRIGLLAGGTGIAPMIQIIRAYSDHVCKYGSQILLYGLNLIYAAEDENDLAYMKLLNSVQDDIPKHFRFYVKLNNPPLGWTEGVGFVGPRDVKAHLMFPPLEGDLTVICGPPVFETAMIKLLDRIGFSSDQWFSFSANDKVSAKT